ncbi:unnamed protein product [Bursaphelenchus xylophilus]|uniref:(pine wood nematode) hypothetical protein n=1 Tax=Bursaphelenchus xylophilus TaxID=6326 RepID=A0A1I7RLW5_BURXY|nr:unnamed protein product [Bursaphelenchus xylophilus]CAG9113284.1 unnamed protein product [Bursaphelenchus xylophilus]
MIFLLILSAISLLLFYNYYYKRRNLPPGPAPLPLLGNVLELIKQERWEDKFLEWSREYGSTFTYWLGEMAFVAVCDYSDMQNYFVKNAEIFSDRPRKKNILHTYRGGSDGVAMANGEEWREQRRFVLKVLRDFGLGKNQMEERITVELQLLLERINNELPADEIDLFKFSDMAVGSIINNIVSGYRFTEGKEDEFYRLKELACRLVKAFASPAANLVLNSSKLMRIPIINEKAKERVELMLAFYEFFTMQIDAHLRENDYTQELEPHDYIDAFLIERQKRIQKNGTEGYFTLAAVRNICLDLWVAGQETTSSTMNWIIAYMIRYPEVQEKLQKELDTVIGSGRIVGNSDKMNLPYANAVIMECQRCCNLVAQNLPRAVSEDVQFDGYVFRKGTIVIPQISVLFRNEKVFPEPLKFNPDRFIDQNGKLRQVEELIPFSLGKRICLGEGMARMELFIFTANLFNQYKFSAGKVPPSLKKVNGASTMIEPFNCKVSLRRQ